MRCSTLNEYLSTIYRDNPNINVSVINYEVYHKFVSLKYCMRLTPKENQRIIFNTSYFSIFTFAVENLTDSDLTTYIEISPDKQFFNGDYSPKTSIKPKNMDILISPVFLKYTALVFEKPVEGHVYIYLQGQF